jgi:hypothetical protein
MKIKNLNFLIILFIFFTNCNPPVSILDYEIVEKKDISYANTPRMTNRVVIKTDSIPSEELLENTAINIWKSGNKSLKEFTVFIYLPEMNTSWAAYAIGEFNENGLVEFKINPKTLNGTKWEIR